MASVAAAAADETGAEACDLLTTAVGVEVAARTATDEDHDSLPLALSETGRGTALSAAEPLHQLRSHMLSRRV